MDDDGKAHCNHFRNDGTKTIKCHQVVSFALVWSREKDNIPYNFSEIVDNFYDTKKVWHSQHKLAKDD